MILGGEREVRCLYWAIGVVICPIIGGDGDSNSGVMLGKGDCGGCGMFIGQISVSQRASAS